MRVDVDYGSTLLSVAAFGLLLLLASLFSVRDWLFLEVCRRLLAVNGNLETSWTWSTAFDALLTSLGLEFSPAAAIQGLLHRPAAHRMEALGAAAAALVPSSPRLAAQPVLPPERLLAQTEATVHKPISFASSPGLPGAINTPW